MITGIIKTWDSNKGWGFVTDDDYGDDYDNINLGDGSHLHY